ncbi:uncharacterized protein [Halyomorpha halys]|uniref:uncharacterized protein n=1 Tax=Halyomorpha halys TaxID=286706 RepID=UPI0006D4F60C
MDRKELHYTNLLLTNNIRNFQQNGDKHIEYSKNKNIVLLLGNTGSGKSTLSQFVSGKAEALLSQEVMEGTGEFVIVDTQNKISSKSTVVSQTVYPDLLEDARTKTLYYDCPGFSDTRSAAHEIAATYFIKKVIDSARSVKLVFVVSHNSVSRGADRQDLILMLQHATDFLKQIEKYKDSIALVVTKVENRYIGNKIVSDEKVIGAIGNYLEQAKRDIDQHLRMVSPDSIEKILFLIDIFLSRGENEQYTRIGIFRKPNESGIITDNELMKEGIISLKNLITKSIQYLEVCDKDFGYTVSAKSKIHINGLVEEINKSIVAELVDMGKKIEKYCITEEEKISDIEYLNSIIQKLKDSFSKIQVNAINETITPEEFISEIKKNINDFKINIPDCHINALKSDGDFINFLNLASNHSIKNYKSSLFAVGLSKVVLYLSESHLVYSFMKDMYRQLSTYPIQKNRNKYSTIDANTLEDFNDCSLIEITDLLKQHNGILKTKLDKPKLKLLNRVLDQTLRYQIEQVSPHDKIVLKGVNVNLSDLSELLRNQNIKFIEVYALHKVFIDTSLDLTGREIQMAIVSPVWEVVGIQSIILDGKPGGDHNPQKAWSGKWNEVEKRSRCGDDGIPGLPGGPAGNLIGIGKHFVNEENLKISANGGKGGRGQDGGDGSEGSSNWYSYEIDKSGGNGGRGGIGGYGGPKGSINIIKVGTESGVVQVTEIAQEGTPGVNGEGGRGGRGGRHCVFRIFPFRIDPINQWANEGKPGQTGAIEKGRKDTWQLKKFMNVKDIIKEFKSYVMRNIKNDLQEMLLRTFLDEIDKYH